MRCIFLILSCQETQDETLIPLWEILILDPNLLYKQFIALEEGTKFLFSTQGSIKFSDKGRVFSYRSGL